MTESEIATRRNGVYVALLVILIVLGVGLFIGTQTSGEEFDSAAFDRRATAIREDLGDLCSSFDFQLKQDVGDGVVRPIHCKQSGTDEIHLRLFVFTDDDTRDAWESEVLLLSSSHPERQEQLEVGAEWAAISFDAEVLELAAKRLEGS